MLDIVIRKLLTNLSPEETYVKITTDYPGLVDSYNISCLLFYWPVFLFLLVSFIVCSIATYLAAKSGDSELSVFSCLGTFISGLFMVITFYSAMQVSYNPKAEVVYKIGYYQQQRINAQCILDGGEVRR